MDNLLELAKGSISTPSKLMQWLIEKRIEYGYIYKGKMIAEPDDNFIKGYRLQSPQETVDRRLGVCWDLVELMRYFFTVWGYEFSTHYMVQRVSNTNTPSHTFLVYNLGGKYYWIEYSFGAHRGIHGPYAALYQVIDDVRLAMIMSNGHSNAPFYEGRYFTPAYGIDGNRFMRHAEQGCRFMIHRPYITYWHPFDTTFDKAVLLKNGLLPADLIADPNQMKEYGSRVKSGIAADYFMERYEALYKKTLKRPYSHWGIYTTPLDLSWNPAFQWRVIIPCKKYEQDMVLQLGADTSMLNERDCRKMMHEFSEDSKVRNIWVSSSLKFKRLPQIVYFGKVPLQVTENMIETM